MSTKAEQAEQKAEKIECPKSIKLLVRKTGRSAMWAMISLNGWRVFVALTTFGLSVITAQTFVVGLNWNLVLALMAALVINFSLMTFIHTTQTEFGEKRKAAAILFGVLSFFLVVLLWCIATLRTGCAIALDQLTASQANLTSMGWFLAEMVVPIGFGIILHRQTYAYKLLHFLSTRAKELQDRLLVCDSPDDFRQVFDNTDNRADSELDAVRSEIDELPEGEKPSENLRLRCDCWRTWLKDLRDYRPKASDTQFVELHPKNK